MRCGADEEVSGVDKDVRHIMKEKRPRLTLEKRLKLKELLDANEHVTNISRVLEVSRGTVYLELKRKDPEGNYDPYYAQAQYEKLQENKGRQSMLLDKRLADYISKAILIEHLSPEKIIERLSEEPRKFPTAPKSPYTIYCAIDKGLIPGVTRESLLQKTIVVSKDGQIWFPLWLREKLDIQAGDILQFEITEDDGILYKKYEK